MCNSRVGTEQAHYIFQNGDHCSKFFAAIVDICRLYLRYTTVEIDVVFFMQGTSQNMM